MSVQVTARAGAFRLFIAKFKFSYFSESVGTLAAPDFCVRFEISIDVITLKRYNVQKYWR